MDKLRRVFRALFRAFEPPFAAIVLALCAPPATAAEPLTQIPERDAARIASARALTLTRATLPAELAAIATAIDRAMEAPAREEARRMVARVRDTVDALTNAAAIAWVQGHPEQALLLAAEAARARPDDTNALNTLGALLADAGYEQKGIPILRHLAQTLPDEPTVLSNLGVAWLNLGEVAEAKVVLARCLARAPGHGPANVAAGVIAESENRKKEATEHFRRATASNSDPEARRVLRQQRVPHGTPKGFMGMVPKREYFSPSSYAPLKPQRQLAEFDLKAAEKKAYGEKLQAAFNAQQKIVQEQTILMMGAMAGGRGIAANPYAKLDWSNHIKKLENDPRLKVVPERLATRQRAIRELRLKYENTRPRFDITVQNAECLARRPIAQAALLQMAEEYDAMVGESLFLWRDLTNARLTYLRFTMPEARSYRAAFAGSVAAYLGQVKQLNDQLPLLQDPCAGANWQKGPEYELAPIEPGDCPFSLEVKAVIATLKMDCTSIGFDFEAGLAFSVKKDFANKGATTLTAGVGGKLDLADVGKASVTGQFVLVWDRKNELSYVGVEAKADAKISGIPGLSGELDQDTFNLGRTAGEKSDGPSVGVSDEEFAKDLVKVGQTTKLGVSIGLKGINPELDGEVSGSVLGEKLFEAKLR